MKSSPDNSAPAVSYSGASYSGVSDPAASVSAVSSSAEPASRSSFWDSIVIGGGPGGLAAALALGRSLRSVLVIDAGQPRNRFASHMHTVLGHEGIEPAALLQKGRAEAAQYGA